MRPKNESTRLLQITRAKAKMVEYGVAEEQQAIETKIPPERLFVLTIGVLADVASEIASQQTSTGDVAAEPRPKDQESLVFASRYFDAYINGYSKEANNDYLSLLAAAAYYLCDLPGSSKVFVEHIGDSSNDECEGLDLALRQLLGGMTSRGVYDRPSNTLNPPKEGGHKVNAQTALDAKIRNTMSLLRQFLTSGTKRQDVERALRELREQRGATNTPRKSLLVEVLVATARKKIANSVWVALPKYSKLPEETWKNVLTKKGFLQEFWPAQHLIGQNGILEGRSGVIQMPTSAGKTKGTELIIRSAFLSKRTSLCVVVAPFRALCHEISSAFEELFRGEGIAVQELTDSLQVDADIADLIQHRSIAVVTPEKLIYILRQEPVLSSRIGLIIYDEGHQFDNGTRGITYELLLTTLKRSLPSNCQIISISAVISNPEQISEWLTGKDGLVVDGKSLLANQRSIGFTSWVEHLGQVKFVSESDINRDEGFVPRVIDALPLKKKSRTEKDRVFPNRKDTANVGKHLALYLGIKMMPQGAVAVFCGRKDTATNMAEMAIDAYERGFSLPPPSTESDDVEITALRSLISRNLGPDSIPTKAAHWGVFLHHTSVPYGIRLCVEHGMRKQDICFVICTSTLAQGVNLPLRYLIVTSIYQAGERIKVRDFQNLMGRAGRSGMHTEGTVIFSDPDVYGNKGQYSWEMIKQLLDASNSERCVSSLSQLVPLHIYNDRQKHPRKKSAELELDAVDFCKHYIEGIAAIEAEASKIPRRSPNQGFTKEYVLEQLKTYALTLASVENFLLAQWAVVSESNPAEGAVALSKETLAYHLANEDDRDKICQIFKILAENISIKMRDQGRITVFGRTLYGLQDLLRIESWFDDNQRAIAESLGDDSLFLDTLWPLLRTFLRGNLFVKCTNQDTILLLAKEWVKGTSIARIFEIGLENQLGRTWGERTRLYDNADIVEICENMISYDGALFLSALAEMPALKELENAESIKLSIQRFQKRLKYGLPDNISVEVFELGFQDRVVAQDLATHIREADLFGYGAAEVLKETRAQVQPLVNAYPRYFRERFEFLVSNV